MANFISVRTAGVGGAVGEAHAIASSAADPTKISRLDERAVRQKLAGRHAVFVTHGFNVNQANGIRCLSRLIDLLAMDDNFAVFGMLWPGDFIIPFINYVWEAGDAVQSGRRLAQYIDKLCAPDAPISFVSHSLGARVVLECTKTLALKGRTVERLCLAAAAVDDDALTTQYADATGDAQRIAVMSSRADEVLRLAYPAGDFINDVFFGDNDSPFRSALGYRGPDKLTSAIRERAIPTTGATQPDAEAFGHMDYVPSSAVEPPPPYPKAQIAAAYMRRALLDDSNYWP